MLPEMFGCQYAVYERHRFLKCFSVAKRCPLEWCTAHINCQPGKYAKAAGTTSSQTDCEVCTPGFFKASTSKISNRTDSCIAHTKCPPGKYTKIAGNTTTQPECEVCPNGFFTALTSSNSTTTDSCVAHTKCPPGKYTVASGSVTAQPKCESCVTGFFKVYTSRDSMCIGVASPAGMYFNMIWRL